jgi:hypothetical protein
MHRAVRVKFPASSSIPIEGTTQELDIVGYQERRSFFGKIGEMVDDLVSTGNAVLIASIPQMTKVVFAKVSSIRGIPPYTIRNNEVLSYVFFNGRAIELGKRRKAIPVEIVRSQEFHQLEICMNLEDRTIPVSSAPVSVTEGTIQVPWQIKLRGDVAKIKVLENDGGVVHPRVPKGLLETY